MGSMRGSLDHPPIIVTIPRTKVAVGFVIAGIVTLSTLFMPRVPMMVEASAWGFALAFFLTLVTSPQLVVSENGLLYQSVFGKKLWAWADFDHFEVYQIPILGLTSPRSHFSENYIRKIQPTPDPLTDVSSGVIGLFWEIPAPELVLLLNQAQQRWSPPGTGGNPLDLAS